MIEEDNTLDPATRVRIQSLMLAIESLKTKNVDSRITVDVAAIFENYINGKGLR